MTDLYYQSNLVLSLLASAIYVFIWHKHFDVHMTVLFVLVPVSELGYVLFSEAGSLEEALLATKLSYVGGCFTPLILTFLVFSMCHIRLNRWIRVGLLALCSTLFLFVLGAGRSTAFYKSVSFDNSGGIPVLIKEYGPVHTAFYAFVVALFFASFAAILFSYFRKKQVSRKMLYLLFLPEVTAMVSFFFGRRLLGNKLELIPAAYVFAQIIYLIIVYRLGLYDVTDTAIDSMVEKGDTGFANFDLKLNYLGSNETARNIFPELNDLTVDLPAPEGSFTEEHFLGWLGDFREDETKNSVHFRRKGKVYLIRLGFLYDGTHKRGYQLFITDDTKNQEHIRLINSFNSELMEKVEEKTAHIAEMHDRLVMSMAVMVESRDNSTGGHIRRTSQGVRILVGEMRKLGYDLSDSFCRNIIKAAPMHDLGKIAVDDAILRKPGRFTDEEFAVMKTHAAEGAKIVHEILEGTDDEEFRRIAENVAHYHHERWDGSGYPCGLKGEEIPLEAQIMAVADVYDALVSKRVYKDKMSFGQADKIIMEGMGRHFDKSLEPCYVSARPLLEEYYRGLE